MNLSREQKSRVRELRSLVLAMSPQLRDMLIAKQDEELVQRQRDRVASPRYAGGSIDSAHRARAALRNANQASARARRKIPEGAT